MTKKYKKIIKRNFIKNYFGNEDESILAYGFLCMIPILGQLMWIFSLISYLSNKEVYYEELKDNKEKE